MNIYPNEINDGLEDKIKASASVSYAALAQPVNDTETTSKIRANKAIAGIDDRQAY